MSLRGVKRRSMLFNLGKYVIPTKQTYLLRGISIVLLLMFVSCNSKSFDTKEELWSYLKDESNGYVQHKNVNDVDFTLIYKPTDLMVQQELDESDDVDKIKALREKYGEFMYFSLSMSKNGQEVLNTVARDRNKFGKMVNELAFGLGEKVHLYTQQKDTLDIVDFVYPRMYGMSKSTDILIVYPRAEKFLKKENEYFNFTIEDFGLYTGEVKFKMPVRKLTEEPSLILN